MAAELHYRAASLSGNTGRVQLDLVARCAGAVVHALWLRKEEWSPAMLRQDVRDAIRGLRVRPGFTVGCVPLLAIGIGANTTVFSVANGVLLVPLPYTEPDRLVQIWETNPSRNWTQATVAPANMLDWRERNRSFEAIAYYVGSDGKRPQVSHASMAGGAMPERVRTMMVSGNFFGLLGAPPRLGRVLQAADAQENAPAVIVLSDGFWRRRFGADLTVVGRHVPLDGQSAEIVGVMAPEFHIPGADADIWAAHRIAQSQLARMRRAHWFRTIARLKPGVTLQQARMDMTRIAGDLEREYADTNRQMGVGLGPLHDWFVGDVRRAVVLLMGAVALVLLIACSNVAGLLLARATGRRREIAIRIALGAGRIRLVRQLLTESLLLAAAGGGVGLALAEAALRILRRTGPADIPRLSTVTMDGWVLAFVLAVICTTAVLVGIVPAVHAAWQTSSDSLKGGSRTTAANITAVRRFIIVGEVALSVVLLAGAGLLLQSFLRLQAVDSGVDVSRTLSFRITLPNQYTDARAATFFSDGVSRLRTIPGVEAAGATARLALEGYVWTGDLFIEDQPDVWGRELRHKAVSPGFFDAAGLPLVRGRDFGPEDTSASPRVTIINQALARRYFAGVDPVGRRISYSRPSADAQWVTIVGVVADEKQDGLDAPVEPEVYSPHSQEPRSAMAIVLRTSIDPAGLLAAIRREVAVLDPTVALYDVRTMEEVVAASVAEERLSTMLVGSFALAALSLAAIGLYGILTFTVTERTREIGVRLALGASRSEVLRMTVASGLRLVAPGIVLGLAAALLMSRALAAFLFETAPADPLVLGGVTMIMLVAGLSASYAPAARASRVDPAISLRAE